MKWLGEPSWFRFPSKRKSAKEESAHIFEDERGRVRWEHSFKITGISLQRPLKKNPWEVQLAVFESQPGCVESQKIGQVILNVASYASKVTEQKLLLPVGGGFTAGELSVTLKVQSALNDPSAQNDSSQFFGWTSRTKQLLSSLKRAYNSDGSDDKGDEGVRGEGSEEKSAEKDKGEEPWRVEDHPSTAKKKALKKAKEKGHKRKPSRSLFARMQQDKSDSSDNDESETTKKNPLLDKCSGDSEENGDGGKKIPERKRTKSNPDLVPIRSPGQLAAIEMVRKFQEGRNPFKNSRKLEGLWEQIKVNDLPLDICFASIDQCFEGVDGYAACSTLAVCIASWMKMSPFPVPDKEGELDQLIREGSQVWREIFQDERSEMCAKFPDMHLDLETAAGAWVERKSEDVSIDTAKSFVGFLMPPTETDTTKRLRDATSGFLTFDGILKEVVSSEGQNIYIVAWNDHFFVIRVCSPDLIYLVDTLGVRLYDGCTKAFIVRFETDGDSAGRSSGAEEEEDDDESEDRAKEEGSLGPRTARDKCKAFFQNVLAVETLDQVVNNLSAMELSGPDKEEEEENPLCNEWQFLLAKLQLELQCVC